MERNERDMRVLYVTDFYYTDSSGSKTSARVHYQTLQNLYGSGNVDLIALVGKSKPNNVNKELHRYIECSQ